MIMKRFVQRLTMGLAFAAASACDDRLMLQPPTPDVTLPRPANARLVLSDSGATAGQQVTLTAFASAQGGERIGSYTARLLYDTLLLRAHDVEEVNDGALRVANPIRGEYRLAGAAANGLTDGLLFRVRFTVLHPKGLRQIGLVLDELHSARVLDLTSDLTIYDGVDSLLAGRPDVKVRPKKPSATP